MLEVTSVFLIVVFITSEFYRFRRRITGLILDVRPLDGDPAGLMGARLQVITRDAREVTAFVSGCQMCVCRIAVGETVSLIPGPNGYVVKSPWIAAGPHRNCPKGVAS